MPETKRSEQPQPVEDLDNFHTAEDLFRSTTTTLSLLIQFAIAASKDDGERGGNPEVENEAWCAIEGMLWDMRRDVQRLEKFYDAARGAK